MTSRSIRFVAPLVLALAACGGGGTTAGPTSTAPPEPAPTAAAPADPAAPATGAKQPTAPGPNLTPDGVVFNFKPDGGGKGKKVFLAGTFNDWKPDNPQYLMADDDGDGTWSITVKLPPGSYQYKFVADGQWIKDPYSPGDAPDGFGGRNGKLDVK